MKKVLITHASLDYDKSHTSWFEMLAFGEYLKSSKTEVRFLSQSLLTADLVDKFDTLIVFSSSKMSDRFKKVLNDSSADLYLVFQDPNWGLDFQINRTYSLITPFNSLSRLTSYKSVMAELKKVLPDIKLSKFSRHYYLPLGNMSFDDEFYDNNSDIANVATQYLGVYVGSQKASRNQYFQQMVDNGVDLYGNFDETRLANEINLASKLYDLKGRIPTNQVKSLLSQYEFVYYAPDEKMISLDVSHRRQVEMLDSKVKLLSTDKQTLSIMAQIGHLDKSGLYRLTRQKLIKHYGQMSRQKLLKIFKLEEPEVTLGQFESLADRFTHPVATCQLDHLYYDADKNEIVTSVLVDTTRTVNSVDVTVSYQLLVRLSVFVEKQKLSSFEMSQISYEVVDKSQYLESTDTMKLQASLRLLSQELFDNMKKNLIKEGQQLHG